MSEVKRKTRELAITDQIRQDVEASAATIAAAIKPFTATLMSDSMQSFFRSVQTTVAPILRMQAQMQKETEWLRSISELKEYVMPSIMYAPPVVRLAQDQFAELADKVTTTVSPQNGLYMDLAYDRNTKELYRHMFGNRITSPFAYTEDNKRLMLVEKLLRTTKPFPTKELVGYLGCSDTKQVRNLVQAVNAKIERDLKLPQPFIVANRRSGYFVNKFYCVLTVK